MTTHTSSRTIAIFAAMAIVVGATTVNHSFAAENKFAPTVDDLKVAAEMASKWAAAPADAEKLVFEVTRLHEISLDRVHTFVDNHIKQITYSGDECAEPTHQASDGDFFGGGFVDGILCFHPCEDPGSIDACVAEQMANMTTADCAVINGMINECQDAGNSRIDCNHIVDGLAEDADLAGSSFVCDQGALELALLHECLDTAVIQCD